MAVSVDELRQLVDAALAASAAVQDDAEAAGRAVAMLGQLAVQQVTTQVLMDSSAGKLVRRLTKHADAGIAAAAVQVVAVWKEAIAREQRAALGDSGAAGASAPAPTSASAPLLARRSSEVGNGAEAEPAAKRARAASAAAAAPTARPKGVSNGSGAGEWGGPEGGGSISAAAEAAAATAAQPSNAAAAAPAAPRAPAKPLVVPKCGDSVRDKTRTLLAEALSLAAVAVPGADAGAVAADVEVAMLRQAGAVNPAYKATYRRLAYNLKDVSNPDLRRRVLAREIAGAALVELPAEELASDERKAANSAIRRSALAGAERGQHMKTATTDQFQCGKCRQRKCQYYQMQTRSADEPMTTFVTCVNCGNRWKFC